MDDYALAKSTIDRAKASIARDATDLRTRRDMRDEVQADVIVIVQNHQFRDGILCVQASLRTSLDQSAFFTVELDMAQFGPIAINMRIRATTREIVFNQWGVTLSPTSRIVVFGAAS